MAYGYGNIHGSVEQKKPFRGFIGQALGAAPGSPPGAPAAPGNPAAGGAIGRAQAAGLYNPGGNPEIMAALSRRAMRSARNRRRRGSLTQRLLGLDPQQARAAQLADERDTGASTADFLNQASENELVGNRDYARQLLSGELDLERQKQLAKYMQDLQGGGFWSGVGGLLGTGVGGFLGGPGGGALGAKLFK